jgi:signal transduction histidine kinase
MDDGEFDVHLMYRLSSLLARGMDGHSFVRTVLRQALVVTGSHGGQVLLLDRHRRMLCPLVREGSTAMAEAEISADMPPMLDTQERLRQSERLAALGITAAGLAHGIRNPLQAMQFLVYAMHQDLPSPSPLHTDLEVIQNEITRLTLLVDQCLDVARPKPPAIRPQKLQEIMEETLLLVGAEAKRRRIRLRKHWPPDLPVVRVDGAQLKQVFLNILLNALQAMESGGVIEVMMQVEGALIATLIRDQGEGIPQELQPHLFTPFFTTRLTGSGLGLSIAQRIMEGHHGGIRVTSQPGGGTTVRIQLPHTGEP